ncbi:MAG: CDP-alcohol phosphatidyltransferase family protein [Gemmatimonadetes bacterium]|nr:CDP-alcohol phosphatidyltransferase family protein [Gemmatimonadota bacterium]
MAELTERPSTSNRVTLADLFTFARIPLAVLFVVIDSAPWRIAILWVAGISDFIDGFLARRYGSSRLGAFLDPVADKVFTISAFGVVLASGSLQWWETVAVLFRDLAATLAFLLTVVFRRPAAIEARLGGKLVTIGQLLALLAFLLESPLLRPIVWVTGTLAVVAVADYVRVARRDNRPL